MKEEKPTQNHKWFPVFPVSSGEKEGEEKDLNSEAPSCLSEMTSVKEANDVSLKETVSLKKEEQSNSIKKVKPLSWPENVGFSYSVVRVNT